MSSISSSPEGESGFTRLLRKVRDGRMSIDEFFREIEFEKWLTIFCYAYVFSKFEEEYGPEELKQESRRKVVKALPSLEPENTPNEGAFFCWLKTLVFYTYLDELRRQGKAQKHGWVRSDTPMESIAVAAPEDDYVARDFLGRFLKFIRIYRAERQFVLMLWLMENCSYREIQEALRDEGIIVSHVTIGNWITASLDAFRKSLGLPSPKQMPKRPRSGPRKTATDDQSTAGPKRGSGDEQQ